MDIRERRILLRAARELADGRRPDWDGLAGLGSLGGIDGLGGSGPEVRAILGRLQEIEAVAEACSLPGDEENREQEVLGVWGDLRLLEKIGEGGFGEVYRAFDPSLQREVALKLQRQADSDLPVMRQRLHLDEARRMARVRHPNVLAIHGAEVREGRAGLWTDLLQGMTLEETIRSGEPCAPDEAVRVGLDLCRALRAVHAAGIVHGDVKAANVMIERDGRVVLMDFGAGSRHGSQELPETRETQRRGADTPGSARPAAPRFGTPAIMAPELLAGRPPSPASDLYSLGVLLYRLLTGRYPYRKQTRESLEAAILSGDRVPLAEVRPDAPQTLIDAVERALSPDPAGRFQDAGQMEIALAAALEQPLPADSLSETADRLHRVPVYGTRFIGRGRELAWIRAALENARLLTLTGPGGTGKTRLAARAAAEMALSFPDGVWWIDLAPLESPDLVAGTAAHMLGAPLQPDSTAEESVVRHLAGQRALLIMDNCEHVRGACVDLAATVLRSTETARILATSREPLSLAGETVQRVSPFALPGEIGTAGPEPSSEAPRTGGADPAVFQGARDASETDPARFQGTTDGSGTDPMESEAVRLFLDRALSGAPGFPISRRHLAAVERICRRLDGLPLALELAAARLRSLGPEQIADQLEADLRIVDDRNSPVGSRQGTLHALVEWSYRLLSAAEQTLFRRLSVFRAPWTLETAGAVCADAAESYGMVGDRGIADLAASLAEKSLVVFDPSTIRYRILEIPRAFALRLLQESDEEPLMRRSKLLFYRDQTRDLARLLQGPEQAAWIRRLEAEHDDLRDALQWAKKNPESMPLGADLAVHLRRFWFLRDHAEEGLRHYQDFARLPGIEARTRAWVLTGACSLAYQRGELARAESLSLQAAEIQREIGDENGLAANLTVLGSLSLERCDFDQAETHLRGALEIRERIGPPLAVATVLTNLGVVAGRRGDTAAARACYEQAVEIFRTEGDRYNEAFLLDNLCTTARESGDTDRAESLGLESARIFRILDDRRGLAQALENLGENARLRGDLILSLERHQEALRIREALQTPGPILGSIEALAFLAHSAGRPTEAAVLLGAAQAYRESTEGRLPPPNLARQRALQASLDSELGENEARQARILGRSLTLQEAIARALRLDVSPED